MQLLSYGAYLPSGRVDLAEVGATLGSGGGRGARVVASFDEDSTTMGVAAARAALATLPGPVPADLYFATTSPAYLDKTNAAAIHAAIGAGSLGFAADLARSGRSGVGGRGRGGGVRVRRRGRSRPADRAGLADR